MAKNARNAYRLVMMGRMVGGRGAGGMVQQLLLPVGLTSFGEQALPDWGSRGEHALAACTSRQEQCSRHPPHNLGAIGALCKSRQSANFARFFAHTNLLSFKPFRAVVASQCLSFDAKFGRLKSCDTVP